MAFCAVRTDLTGAFRDDGARDGDVRRSRSARFLLSAQVAISLLLLVGAGLFIRTLGNLRTTDSGFDGRDGGAPDVEIVGVIADTKYRTLRGAIPNTARM